jgi:hypothetical protein
MQNNEIELGLQPTIVDLLRKNNALLRENNEIRNTMSSWYEPPCPSKKEIKKYSDSAPISLFNFALTVSNIIIFLLNSEIIAEAISKVFNLDNDKLIDERKLKIIKETTVFAILICFSLYLLYIEFKKSKTPEEEKQIDNTKESTKLIPESQEGEPPDTQNTDVIIDVIKHLPSRRHSVSF